MNRRGEHPMDNWDPMADDYMSSTFNSYQNRSPANVHNETYNPTDREGSRPTAVYVGNMPRTMDRNTLNSLFSICGQVMRLHVPTKNNNPPHYCFINFSTHSEAQMAIRKYNRQPPYNMNVSYAHHNADVESTSVVQAKYYHQRENVRTSFNELEFVAEDYSLEMNDADEDEIDDGLETATLLESDISHKKLVVNLSMSGSKTTRSVALVRSLSERPEFSSNSYLESDVICSDDEDEQSIKESLFRNDREMVSRIEAERELLLHRKCSPLKENCDASSVALNTSGTNYAQNFAIPSKHSMKPNRKTPSPTLSHVPAMREGSLYNGQPNHNSSPLSSNPSSGHRNMSERVPRLPIQKHFLHSESQNHVMSPNDPRRPITNPSLGQDSRSKRASFENEFEAGELDGLNNINRMAHVLNHSLVKNETDAVYHKEQRFENRSHARNINSESNTYQKRDERHEIRSRGQNFEKEASAVYQKDQRLENCFRGPNSDNDSNPVHQKDRRLENRSRGPNFEKENFGHQRDQQIEGRFRAQNPGNESSTTRGRKLFFKESESSFSKSNDQQLDEVPDNREKGIKGSANQFQGSANIGGHLPSLSRPTALDGNKTLVSRSEQLGKPKGLCFESKFLTAALPIDKSVEVCVTHMEGSFFWIQMRSDELKAALQCQDEMRMFVDAEISTVNPRKGLMCAAKFSSDGLWYRAEIKHYCNSSVSVYYVDYGNSEDVAITDLRTIVPEFLKISAQAIKCKLSSDSKIPHTKIKPGELYSASFHFKERDYSVVVLEVSKRNTKKIGQETQTLECPMGTSFASAPDVLDKLQAGQPIKIIIMVVSGEGFWGQIVVPGHEDIFGAVLQEMKKFVESSSNSIRPTESNGLTIVAAFSPADNDWYRAVRLPGKSSVFYIDYGNEEVCEKVQLLPEQLSKLPSTLFHGSVEKVLAKNLANLLTVDSVVEFVPQNRIGNVVYGSITDMAVSVATVKLVPWIEKVPIMKQAENSGYSGKEKTDERRITAQMTSNSAKTVASISKRFLLSDLPSLNLNVGQTYSVMLLSAYSFDSIHVILYEFESVLTYVNDTVAKACNDKAAVYTPAQGEVVCAKFSDDNRWYRAVVMAKRGTEVDVRFIDFGNVETTSCENIRKYPESIKVNPLALKVAVPKKSLEYLKLLRSQVEKKVDMIIKDKNDTAVVVEFLNIGNTPVKPIPKVETSVQRQAPPEQALKQHHDVLTHRSPEQASKQSFVAQKHLSPEQASKQSLVVQKHFSPELALKQSHDVQERFSPSKHLHDLQKHFPPSIHFNELQENLSPEHTVKRLDNEQNKQNTAVVPTLGSLPTRPLKQTERLRAVINTIEKEDIYVSLMDDIEQMVKLNENICDLCSEKQNSCYMPSVLEIACGKSLEDDSWNRVEILELLPGKVLVRFIDFGTREEIASEHIQKLPAFGLDHPVYAKKVKVSDVLRNHIAMLESKTVDMVVIDDKGVIPVVTFMDMNNEPLVTITESANEHKNENLMDKLLLQPSVNPIVADFGTTMNVVVNYAVHNKVFVVPSERVEELNELGSLLTSHCTNAKSDGYLPAVNEITCAYYDVDTCWYRARVNKIDGNEICVFFIDYGNDICVKLDQVRKLPEEAARVPIYTFCVRMTEDCVSVLVENADKPVVMTVIDKAVDPFVVKFSSVKLVENLVASEVEPVGSKNQCASPQKPTGEMPKSKELPPSCETKTNVFTSTDLKVSDIPLGEAMLAPRCVLSPEMIFCTVLDRSALEEFGHLSEAINAHCNNAAHTVYLPLTGHLCLAKFTDGEWYRAMCLMPCSPAVKLLFVDYGNIEMVLVTDILPMQPEFMQLPQQVVQCLLYDLKDEHWNNETCEALKEILKIDVPVNAVVKEKRDDHYIIEIPELASNLDKLDILKTTTENAKAREEAMAKERLQRLLEEKEEELRKLRESLKN